MTFGTTRGREALSLSIAFTTLATVFTFIRIYTRTFLVKQMGADDWAIIVALVSLSQEFQSRGRICRLTLAGL
jgi:hypothetical protein